MKRLFRNVFLFLAPVGILLIAYGIFCDWFFLQEKYFPKESKRMWSMSLTHQKFDYAILGSSRANGAFDMEMLDSIIGFRGVNIAADGSGYVDNYLVLYKFLQNQNSIQYLFLQTDNYSFDPEKNFSNAFHVYNFLPYWHEDEFNQAISHYLDLTDQFVFNSFPWMRYYKYNKYYSPLQVIQRLKNYSSEKQKLPESFKAVNYPDLTYDTTKLYGIKGSKNFNINHFDESYLLKIIELCKHKRINILCFQAPDFHTQDIVYNNYNSTSDYLLELLNKQKVVFIKQDEILRKNSACFKDAGHLNDFGRYMFTNYFSSKIATTMKSHKQDNH